MIVFPRTTVELTMFDQDTIIGSPNIAVFYNHGTKYKRRKLSDQGDRCDFLQFNRDLLREVLLAHQSDYHACQPFQFSHALLNRENFARQRDMVRKIGRSTPLAIDEMGITLLESVVHDGIVQWGGRPTLKPMTRRVHQKLALDAQELLVTRHADPLTLTQIAGALHVSPYHLSRVFRQQTGCTLHQFREQLRLRIAHDRLGDYPNNLSQLALSVGYASHSHFTEAFRRAFGVPPSQLARAASESE